MSKKFLTHIDLNQNELQNIALQRLASNPANPVSGQVYYNTANDTVRYYDGAEWVTVGSGSGSGDMLAATYDPADGARQVAFNDELYTGDEFSNSGTYANLRAQATTKGDVGLGNVTDDAQLKVASNLSDLANAGTARNHLGLGDLATKSDIATTDIASATLVTASDTIASNDNDTTLPTSAAVKAYADSVASATETLVFKGTTDASSNPNYPAGIVGDLYKISVAGKIGGASGIKVQAGDTVYCIVANAGGTQASVGSNWAIIQANVDQATDDTLGLVELATQAEAEAQTSTTKALTPASVSTFTQKRSFTIGDGTAKSIAVTHNLGTKDVMVQLRQVSDDEVVEADIVNTSTTQTTIDFTDAPANNSIRVVVIG